MGPADASDLGGRPSLDPRDQSLPQDQCPNWDGHWLLNHCTGERVPTRCRANRCAFCLPRNATRRSLAIALADPSLFLTLTLVGDEFPQIRARWNRVRYEVARAGYPFDAVWHVERFKRLDSHHIHAWLHGQDRIPFQLLQRTAVRYGMGQVLWIKRWETRAESVGYGLKGIAYGMKAADTEAYMVANGGRISHATRGYWRCGGQRVAGVRAAERAAIARIQPACENPRVHSCGFSIDEGG